MDKSATLNEQCRKYLNCLLFEIWKKNILLCIDNKITLCSPVSEFIQNSNSKRPSLLYARAFLSKRHKIYVSLPMRLFFTIFIYNESFKISDTYLAL